MRQKRNYTEAEKQQVLEETTIIKNMASVARKYKIPTATIRTWVHNKSKRKINADSDLKSENKKLQKKINDQELENNILKELLKKTVQVLS